MPSKEQDGFIRRKVPYNQVTRMSMSEGWKGLNGEYRKVGSNAVRFASVKTLSNVVRGIGPGSWWPKSLVVSLSVRNKMSMRGSQSDGRAPRRITRSRVRPQFHADGLDICHRLRTTGLCREKRQRRCRRVFLCRHMVPLFV